MIKFTNITEFMIKSFALFDGLPEEDIQALMHAAIKRIIPAKTVFIEQETSSETAFLILDGSVNVYRIDENGDEIGICILGSGDIVGEMSLIDHEPRSAFVKTLTETTVLTLSQTDFVNILQKHPKIAIHLLSSLSKRLRTTNQHLEDVLSKSLTTRTWNTLQLLQHYFKKNEISLTHEELASIVGATRARITEILDNFQEEGKISLSHRRITFL